MTAREGHYLGIFVDCVRSCAAYRPKFGQGKSAGLTLAEFRDLCQSTLVVLMDCLTTALGSRLPTDHELCWRGLRNQYSV